MQGAAAFSLLVGCRWGTLLFQSIIGLSRSIKSFQLIIHFKSSSPVLSVMNPAHIITPHLSPTPYHSLSEETEFVMPPLGIYFFNVLDFMLFKNLITTLGMIKVAGTPRHQSFTDTKFYCSFSYICMSLRA